MMSRRTGSKLLLGSALGAGVRAQQALPTHKPLPKFSCMLWTLEPGAPLERCLEIVAAAGYQGVELVGEFHKWSPAEMLKSVARLRDLKLVVDAASGVKTGFATPGAADEFVTQCKAQLQSMQELNCGRLILLSGAAPSVSPAQQRETALDNLRRACDLAAAAQVEVLIEPIDPLESPGVYLRSVAEAFDIARELNRPNLKVLYDLYHEQRGLGNLIEKLDAHIDLVGLVHVADVPGRHEPGTGEINFPMIYKELARLGYAQWIAMEFMPTGDPETTLRQARLQAQKAFALG